MTKVSTSNFKRDGQHETPQATSSKNGGSATSAPDPYPLRRSRRLQGYEADTEKSTKSSKHLENAAQNSAVEIYVNEANEKPTSDMSDHSSHVIHDYKSTEPTHQVQPDSEPSIVGREGSDLDQSCVHYTRLKEASEFKRDQNVRIVSGISVSIQQMRLQRYSKVTAALGNHSPIPYGIWSK